MRRKYIATILFILIFSTENLSGHEQDIIFKHLTSESGLAQNWIKCIFQDSYGYLWFGTGGSGVNKYDGYEFKLYNNDLLNRNSLSNNWINTIYEDKEKRLWIGTQHGLNQYDREKDVFIRFPFFIDEYIVGMFEPEAGNMFVVTSLNIYEIDFATNNVTPFCKGVEGFQYNFSAPIVKDYMKNLWVPSINGLYLVDLANKKLTAFMHNENDPRSLSDNNLQCIYKDSHGRVWLGTTNEGICLIEYEDEKASRPYFKHFHNDPHNPYSINKGMVRAIIDDRKGNLWIGTENGGINVLNLGADHDEEAVFKHYLKNIFDDYSLSNNSIYAIYKDIQGIIWVGTYGGGVNYFSNQLQKFEQYRQTPSPENLINDNTINAIFEDGPDIWIGTEGGIYIINPETSSKSYLIHDPDIAGSIGSNSIWSIYKDRQNNIWVGTWAGGLNLFNPETKKFKRFLNDPDNPFSISSNNVFSITEDEEGYLWLATMGGGLNRYDRKTGRFMAYRADITSPNNISGDWVQTMLVSSNNEFWISTSDGVDLFDKETGRFYNFKHDSANTRSISYDGANIIFEDSKRNIWLGTDGGLNYFIRDDSSFVYYNDKNGLPNNSIKGICEDENGNLWISTNNGLSKFINGVNTPLKPNFKNFYKSDGLQGNEFGRRSCLKSKNGKLYFGGVNGFNAFYPDSIKDNLFIPHVVLTDFLIFNKPLTINAEGSPLKEHISLTKKIILKHNLSVLTFKFAALNFILPEKNQYAYMMDGFEEEWNYVGNKREITYTNLAPGEYTLRVKASNNDQHWNEAGISLQIIILPPWWKTTWFRILFFLFIAGSIVAFFYFRLSQLNKQKLLLERMVNQRTREIQEQKNTLLRQTDELNEINTLLEERQQRIEEQSEELRAQAEELYTTNTKLLSLNATKDKFFSIIAHDLKNPFNSVLGFCEILFQRYDNYDDTKRKHLIGIVYQSATNIYKLLENLLQWARSQTGAIRYEPEIFEITELVRNNTTLVENLLTDKKLDVELESAEEVKVFADKNMINTVIRNLISNAIKFTESGQIFIRVKEEGDFIMVSMKDTGIGMTSDKANALFEIGASKSTEGTRGEPGTGLGLIICKEFVERNGGYIGVKSELNKGSIFYFTVQKPANIS